jgi:hypothetical protein
MHGHHHKEMTASATMICLSEREIFRADLAAHLVGLQLEVDLLALVEAGEARTLDRADMHEHVVAAIARLDEAKTLLAVKPLHCTCRHRSRPLFQSAHMRVFRARLREPSNLSDVFGKEPCLFTEDLRRSNKTNAGNRIPLVMAFFGGEGKSRPTLAFRQTVPI